MHIVYLSWENGVGERKKMGKRNKLPGLARSPKDNARYNYVLGPTSQPIRVPPASKLDLNCTRIRVFFIAFHELAVYTRKRVRRRRRSHCH